MRQEISYLRERLEQFESLESSIQAALVHAEQAANDLRQSAVQEAEDLRESSRREVESLQQSLQLEAENLRQSANREAELTVQEARLQAQQVFAEASARIEDLQESYESLRNVKRRFAGDFRRLLESYLESVEETESTLSVQEPQLRGITGGSPEGEEATGAIEVTMSEPGERGGEVGKDPETEEPEFDPSSLENEPPDEKEFPGEPGAEEEVDREEPMPDGEASHEDATEDLWGVGKIGEDDDFPEDGEDENRMFRASRYLRRRD